MYRLHAVAKTTSSKTNGLLALPVVIPDALTHVYSSINSINSNSRPSIMPIE